MADTRNQEDRRNRQLDDVGDIVGHSVHENEFGPGACEVKPDAYLRSAVQALAVNSGRCMRASKPPRGGVSPRPQSTAIMIKMTRTTPPRPQF